MTLFLLSHVLAAEPQERPVAWFLFDDGRLLFWASDESACHLGGAEAPRKSVALDMSESPATSFSAAPFGDARLPGWTPPRTLVALEMVDGASLTAALPGVAPGAVHDAGGWISKVHPAWVWGITNRQLIAPTGLLRVLSECSLDVLPPLTIRRTLSTAAGGVRPALIALLNEWLLLRGLADGGGRLYGAQGAARGFPGERVCADVGACGRYVDSWEAAANSVVDLGTPASPAPTSATEGEHVGKDK